MIDIFCKDIHFAFYFLICKILLIPFYGMCNVAMNLIVMGNKPTAHSS